MIAPVLTGLLWWFCPVCGGRGILSNRTKDNPPMCGVSTWLRGWSDDGSGPKVDIPYRIAHPPGSHPAVEMWTP